MGLSEKDRGLAAKADAPAYPVQELTADGTPATLSSGLSKFEHFAGLAMQAYITAAWSTPGPATTAYEKAKADVPPGETLSFDEWIADRAAISAIALIKATGSAA